MPISFMSSSRGSGSKKASMPGITQHLPPRRPSSGRAEAAAALGDVVAGAARHRHLAEGRVGDVVADLVPDGELGPAVDSTYLMTPSYSRGRNFVSASRFSYRWLSASNVGTAALGG